MIVHQESLKNIERIIMNKYLQGLCKATCIVSLLQAGPLAAQSVHHSGKAMPDANAVLEPPYLALTNANVLDVRTGEILENRTVVL